LSADPRSESFRSLREIAFIINFYERALSNYLVNRSMKSDQS
jgi:hypothetical protein